MNLLFDTNIILAIIRSKNDLKLIDYLNPNKKSMYTSVVIEAELKSMAIRNNWGKEKFAKVDFYMDLFVSADISKALISTYVEIDTYSQRKNPKFKDYLFDSAINMGKNDLWIASTAALLSLELVTTDSDFNNLHNVFLDVRHIKIPELQAYL